MLGAMTFNESSILLWVGADRFHPRCSNQGYSNQEATCWEGHDRLILGHLFSSHMRRSRALLGCVPDVFVFSYMSDSRDAHGVTVSVVGNGIGDLSSNPGPSWLLFPSH